MPDKKPADTPPTFEVLVDNIGSVHTGTDEAEAQRVFRHYCDQSSSRQGRAGGEPVDLLKNGELIDEFVPSDPFE